MSLWYDLPLKCMKGTPPPSPHGLGSDQGKTFHYSIWPCFNGGFCYCSILQMLTLASLTWLTGREQLKTLTGGTYTLLNWSYFKTSFPISKHWAILQSCLVTLLHGSPKRPAYCYLRSHAETTPVHVGVCKNTLQWRKIPDCLHDQQLDSLFPVGNTRTWKTALRPVWRPICILPHFPYTSAVGFHTPAHSPHCEVTSCNSPVHFLPSCPTLPVSLWYATSLYPFALASLERLCLFNQRQRLANCDEG